MLLAGDIGGTNTRLWLFSEDGTHSREDVLESREHPSLEAAVRVFLGPEPPVIDAACFGIAGPVIDQKCTATNLPWTVDAVAVGRKLGIREVRLVNDLVALAHGAALAPASGLRALTSAGLPMPAGRNLAIVAAGTGLGEAALVWDGARHVTLATEGGHGDFAPRNELEAELLTFLRGRFGRVSYERILSGPGIQNLYEFFRDARGLGESEENARRIAAADQAPVAISQLASAGASRAASAALDLFVSLYGAEVGNVALRYFALGGVFVAGSIASSLADKLAGSEFWHSYTGKGRFAPLLESTPVALVLDSKVGLSGAAAIARTLV